MGDRGISIPRLGVGISIVATTLVFYNHVGLYIFLGGERHRFLH